MTTRHLVLILSLALALISPVKADEVVVPPPTSNSVCPVCGMFVAKFPEWIAYVVYKDGHAHYFDGTKDMFKFLADPKRFSPGHRPEDVAFVAVTDYYSVTPMDAHDAFYVIGSDILGPMGHELVPLSTEADAKNFLNDHQGKAILRFSEIKKDVIDKVDAGQIR